MCLSLEDVLLTARVIKYTYNNMRLFTSLGTNLKLSRIETLSINKLGINGSILLATQFCA